MKALILAFKEIRQYFKSPVAYIVLLSTITIFNIIFFIIVEQNAEASLRDVFKFMEFMFVFIVPLLTMKVFAEERSSGTFEMLMTSPVSNWGIVGGKYLGVLLFMTVIFLATLPYYFILEYFSSPDASTIFTGYAGLWLEIGLFIAIGILASALTRYQVIAAIGSYTVIFLLYFSVSLTKYVDGWVEEVLRVLSVWPHTENFIVGIISTQDMVYFISSIGLCLVLTRFSLWKR